MAPKAPPGPPPAHRSRRRSLAGSLPSTAVHTSPCPTSPPACPAARHRRPEEGQPQEGQGGGHADTQPRGAGAVWAAVGAAAQAPTALAPLTPLYLPPLPSRTARCTSSSSARWAGLRLLLSGTRHSSSLGPPACSVAAPPPKRRRPPPLPTMRPPASQSPAGGPADPQGGGVGARQHSHHHRWVAGCRLDEPRCACLVHAHSAPTHHPPANLRRPVGRQPEGGGAHGRGEWASALPAQPPTLLPVPWPSCRACPATG